MIESKKSSCYKTINRECYTHNKKAKEWYKIGQNTRAILNTYFGNKDSKYNERKDCTNDSTYQSTKNTTKKSKKLIVRWC